MKNGKNGIKTLEKALKTAYNEQRPNEGMEALVKNNGWEAVVMNQIRGVGPLHHLRFHQVWRFLALLEASFWRIVPATCALIIVLAALNLVFSFSPELEMAVIAMDNPVGYELIQPLG